MAPLKGNMAHMKSDMAHMKGNMALTKGNMRCAMLEMARWNTDPWIAYIPMIMIIAHKYM